MYDLGAVSKHCNKYWHDLGAVTSIVTQVCYLKRDVSSGYNWGEPKIAMGAHKLLTQRDNPEGSRRGRGPTYGVGSQSFFGIKVAIHLSVSISK